MLSVGVKETICRTPTPSKPYVIAAPAASVAYPCPHADRFSRQPTSTAGVKCASNPGSAEPYELARLTGLRQYLDEMLVPVDLHYPARMLGR